METTHRSGQPCAETVWLSGEMLTLFSKLVFPTIWLAVFWGVVLSLFVKRDHLSIVAALPLVVGLVIPTAFLLWTAARLQRVGHMGVNLTIANYLREAQVPFEEIEAVEPVWWYRTRMVRIRFRKPTPFGHTVYYLSKWTLAGTVASTSEQELRDLLMQAGVLT